ncbi:MAG: undecaprenyl-diphosphate phosphatase, partial [Pseudomonadota bacterium]
AGLVTGALDLIRGRWDTPAAKLAWLVGIASVPAVAAGLALKLAALDDGLRTIEIIGWATLLGGILLYLADTFAPTDRRAATADAEEGTASAWRLGDAVIMGLAQALALIPGTSRSGITMTAARGLGFGREEAARLSLVMAIPLIIAATSIELAGIVSEGAPQAASAAGSATGSIGMLSALALAAVLSCLAALAALVVMFSMFRRAWTMTPFVIYRVGLGIALLTTAYS